MTWSLWVNSQVPECYSIHVLLPKRSIRHFTGFLLGTSSGGLLAFTIVWLVRCAPLTGNHRTVAGPIWPSQVTSWYPSLESAVPATCSYVKTPLIGTSPSCCCPGCPALSIPSAGHWHLPRQDEASGEPGAGPHAHWPHPLTPLHHSLTAWDVEPCSGPGLPKKPQPPPGFSQEAALSLRIMEASIPTLMCSRTHSLKAWAPEEEKTPLFFFSQTWRCWKVQAHHFSILSTGFPWPKTLRSRPPGTELLRKQGLGHRHPVSTSINLCF